MKMKDNRMEKGNWRKCKDEKSRRVTSTFSRVSLRVSCIEATHCCTHTGKIHETAA